MDYRCPKCKERLNLGKLLFSDISQCAQCGQKVVLGDFFALAMSCISMLVTSLSMVYTLTHAMDDPYIAGVLAVLMGLGLSTVVLLLLGRAKPYISPRSRNQAESAAG